MGFGLIGDLITGLPILTYFKKKYPDSYIYWGIEKKVSFCAPIYLNHPLIDRIKITDNWGGVGKTDLEIISKCDFMAPKFIKGTSEHSSYDWYNQNNLVEETAYLHGIYDIKDHLSEEEMKPKLEKWFDVGFENTIQGTYSKENNINLRFFNKNIAIWPFTGNGIEVGRCPSEKWWKAMISKLIVNGYTVFHYGLDSQPRLSNSDKYKKLTYLSFFQQIKASLASKFFISSSTGPIWIMGAYQHPGIILETYWLPGHNKNKNSVTPINDNGIIIFVEKNNLGCDKISHEDIILQIKNLRIINE